MGAVSAGERQRRASRGRVPVGAVSAGERQRRASRGRVRVGAVSLPTSRRARPGAVNVDVHTSSSAVRRNVGTERRICRCRNASSTRRVGESRATFTRQRHPLLGTAFLPALTAMIAVNATLDGTNRRLPALTGTTEPAPPSMPVLTFARGDRTTRTRPLNAGVDVRPRRPHAPSMPPLTYAERPPSRSADALPHRTRPSVPAVDVRQRPPSHGRRSRRRLRAPAVDHAHHHVRGARRLRQREKVAHRGGVIAERARERRRRGHRAAVERDRRVAARAGQRPGPSSHGRARRRFSTGPAWPAAGPGGAGSEPS